jgi:hypothetical protein
VGAGTYNSLRAGTVKRGRQMYIYIVFVPGGGTNREDKICKLVPLSRIARI